VEGDELPYKGENDNIVGEKSYITIAFSISLSACLRVFRLGIE